MNTRAMPRGASASRLGFALMLVVAARGAAGGTADPPGSSTRPAPGQGAPVVTLAEHDRAYYVASSRPLVFTNECGATMPYRLFVPRDVRPGARYPLVLVLHGAGARGTNNLDQLRYFFAGWMDDGVQVAHPCYLLLPQCPRDAQWVNTPWSRGSYALADKPISEPLAMACRILDRVSAEHAVDRRRLYVLGASMGGYGAWDFAMRFPDRLAALVPICGAGDPASAARLKDLPIWAFHGDQDRIVPLRGTLDMVEAVRQAGNPNVHCTIYEGVGHDSYKRAWKEEDMIDWLFKQQRKITE